MLLAQVRHSEQRAALLGFALGFLPVMSFLGAGIAPPGRFGAGCCRPSGR